MCFYENFFKGELYTLMKSDKPLLHSHSWILSTPMKYCTHYTHKAAVHEAHGRGRGWLEEGLLMKSGQHLWIV